MNNSQNRVVAFQGERGAYSEMAALEVLGKAIQTKPYHSFEDVFENVESGAVDLGIVPIENSLGGSIHRNYDLLLRHNLHIIGEKHLRIEHCLIVNPGVTLNDIQIVRSHPQALAQCEHHLKEMGVRVEASYDTAGSVRELRESGSRDTAALAGRWAAVANGMAILKEEMEDDEENYTRFLILSREPLVPSTDVKTSIVFALKNQPAVLFRALACFALRDIDLTKIESRPIPGSPWEYHFYLDFLGSQYQEVGQRALAHLGEMAEMLRILGTYPTERPTGPNI